MNLTENIVCFLRGCLHEISSCTEWNDFKSVSAQGLINVYMKYSKMKLIACVISLLSFWQKWNFVSGDKCYAHTTPKWNHTNRKICACEYLKKNKDSRAKYQNENEFHFISPIMKTHVNRIFSHG